MFQKLANNWVISNEKKGIDRREAMGVFASIVGAISNMILFLIKLVVGFTSGSVAITADSINNLADSGASIVTLVGFKMGQKPADGDHPFGHGRIEYIAAFIVSMIILVLGFEFLISSFKKIWNPEPVTMNFLMYLILIITVLTKVWQSIFYKFYGKKIDSDGLMAVSKDSFFDVIITSITILAAFIYDQTGWQIDGIAGVFVALMLLYAGVEIARETLSPLLGEKPDKELVRSIKKIVESHPEVIRSHDLVIHNYGPEEYMATIHVEMSNSYPVEAVHELVHTIMDKMEEALGIHLLIHVDPVDTSCERLQKIRELLDTLLINYEGVSAHEFAWSTDQEEACFEMTFTLDYTQLEKDKMVATIKNRLHEEGISSHIHVGESMT